MATIASLEKEYLGRRFANGGGETTREYDSFQRKYINCLKGICENNGWALVKVSKMHYQFSAFIKDQNEHFVYLSISDVRFFPDQWHTRILVRGAKNEKDYTGMNNEYTSLPEAERHIRWLFSRLARMKAQV